MIMNVSNMVYASFRSNSRVQNLLNIANEIAKDLRASERTLKNECKSCFYYVAKIGGSAITHKECMCCGIDQMYGSTCTDVLCLECAKKHKLCRHCGGDINMNERRRKWPSHTEQNDK